MTTQTQVQVGVPTKEILVTKADGTQELFNRVKLESSLLRSGAPIASVESIIEHIERELEDGMSTSEIYKHAFFLLHKQEKNVSMRYSLRRAIMDLGPSGFPFEEYVAALFKEKGYATLTDQLVTGDCVEHEIDVVAYNENKLIMAEAKFHNELGTKSDLKVALYVKARFDDLKGTLFTSYGKERKLDEGWLITNTKFTTSAIEYGTHHGLKMIGWNYPERGNLQDIIEDGDLHPITCLTGISKNQITSLIKGGVVLCKTILGDTSILKSLGLSDAEMSRVVEEIKML